ncbi:MAG: FAD-dependent oxidoreductase, partial [Gammaproteobacteria bacterium]
YTEALSGRAEVGERVAIIGAGGIGFDVAEFLVGNPEESTNPEAFRKAWGVDAAITSPGGLAPPGQHRPRRRVHMLQRKPGSLGKSLGKSTGWILKAKLRRAAVEMIAGARYELIDDRGLHYTANGERRLLEVDNVIVCAGQEPERSLHDALSERGIPVYLIGGAHEAAELDAYRAIDQATRLAVSL